MLKIIFTSAHLQKIYKYFVMKVPNTNEHKTFKHIKEELNMKALITLVNELQKIIALQ